MAGDGPRFGFLGREAFLNHASVAPPCRAARRAVRGAAEGIAREDDRFVHSRDTSRRSRQAFARYVGARTDRVQCFQNTSAALSAVAWGLRWRRGDEVLVSRNEFVSNYLVWELQRRRGVRIRLLPTRDEWVDPAVLHRHVGRRTRVVAVSAVHWATGAKQDLRALSETCHGPGALLVVDAAQSLGAVRHSRRRDGYDVLATNTYKWLLSFNGTAFAEFSSAVLDALEPSSVGWLSVSGDPEPPLDRRGRPRYRLGRGVEWLLGGAPSALSNLAAIAALRDLESYGQARIEQETARAAQRVMEWAEERGLPVVTPRERGRHAGIVALGVRQAERAARRLRGKGVRLGSRGGFLRISPHFYMSDGDLERLDRAARKVGLRPSP